MKDLAKVEEIYHRALEYPPNKREIFLKKVCGDDKELLSEVKSLLAFDESAQDFFEKLPEDVAADYFSSRQQENLIGKELSHYRILSTLGAGGMGEVYLAEDTKLKRKIALKLLPFEFASDPERKNRFEQEAFAVSALNHPNIITIYGVEKNEQFNFIATEFIDGQTLRRKIAEKPFDWQETLDIAIQIADALESAHSVGIIHRDIKPSNIMIRHDGYVKVLDFGLVKLTDQSISMDKPEWQDNTELNQVMGTINYMSPEQALGEEVDTRTDIFSLGVVLYEMLSGVQPFKGATDGAIYNETVNKIPSSLVKLNSNIPVALERIVFKTIEKNRENRYQTVAELRSDLQKLQANPDLSASHFIASQKKTNFLKFLLPVAAFGFLIITGIYFAFLRQIKPVEAKIFSYSQLTTQSGEELFPNLSPNGKNLLYSSRENGNWDIYLQQIKDSNRVNLTENSIADDKQAVFSPNGEQIAFRSERDGGGIFVMSSNGENVRKITDLGFYPSWSPDGKEIAYCIDDVSEPGSRAIIPSELWSVNVATGEKRLITEADAVQPSWSPNGFRIAFWGINEGGQRDIWTISAQGGEPVAVTADASIDWNPVWSADGKYLYFVSNRSGSMNLWRVEIDEKSGTSSNEPESITIPSNYSQFFNFSRDGKGFIYVQTVNYSNIFKIDFDEKKETVSEKAIEIIRGSKITTNPEVSWDGESITFDAIGDKQEDIFVAKSNGNSIRQLTNDVYKDRTPRWSPDGKRIAFFTDETGKYEGYVMNADGSNRIRITQYPENHWAQLPIWSPDGKHLIFNTSNGYPVIYNPDKDWTQQMPQILPDEGDPKRWFMAFSWSPDGKKLVGYSRNTEKILQTSIRIYDFATQKYETVSEFGTRPVWLDDSRRVIFYSRDKLYLLDTKTKKTKELLSVAPNRFQSISISKDNRSIYYALQKSESDIWLANTQFKAY